MAKVGLQGARIKRPVGERVTAGMSKHVRVRLEAEPRLCAEAHQQAFLTRLRCILAARLYAHGRDNPLMSTTRRELFPVPAFAGTFLGAMSSIVADSDQPRQPRTAA
jgi:hypothetical protein